MEISENTTTEVSCAKTNIVKTQNDTAGETSGSANDDTMSVGSSSSLMSTSDAIMDDGVYTEEDIKRSEEFKEKGNTYFKGKIPAVCLTSIDNKFEQSVDMYSEAILCKIAPAKKSVLYCNRALAQLKLENYAIALYDACESVKLDNTNIKGYYRRA